MNGILIVLGIIGFFVFFNWLCKPVCAACGKKIYESTYTGVGSPANVSLHDRKSCDDIWQEMVHKEPYVSRTREYIELLDRKHKGEKISKKEWLDFHKSCR